MEPGRLAFTLTLIIYAIFIDCRIAYIYFLIIFGLTLFHVLTPRGFNSTRRKLQIASWEEPREGTIRTKYLADTTKLEELIKQYREKNNVKVTMLHFVVKIFAEIMKDCPDINGKVIFGKYFANDRVNVSAIVDIENGKDLAVTSVQDADKKGIDEIAKHINETGANIKTHKDKTHKTRIAPLRFTPSFLNGLALEIFQILLVDFGLDLPLLGWTSSPFGCVGVSNVGTIGIKDAYAPNMSFTRLPILVTLCQSTKRAVVKNDKIEIATVMDINLTIDHRFMDGGRVKKVITKLDDYFENPEQILKPKLETEVIREQTLEEITSETKKLINNTVKFE